MTTAPSTRYKGHPVHVVHVTEIHQTIDGHDEASTMAKIYFTDETQDDAYYVPANEVTGLAAPRTPAEFVTNSRTIVLGEVLAWDSSIAWPDLGYTRQDIVDELHGRAVGAFQAHLGRLRETLAGLSIEDLDMAAFGVTGYRHAEVMDELHRRALKEYHSTSGETMTVRVIDRSGWGTSAPYPAIRQVEISVYCPACGERRGRPRNRNFHEDGQWLSCDVWDNPCGHVDMYEAVLAECS